MMILKLKQWKVNKMENFAFKSIKLYSRIITSRGVIFDSGTSHIGFKLMCEYVLTDNINAFNYRKKVKFVEISEEEFKNKYGFNPFQEFRNGIINMNEVHSYFIQNASKDIYK